MVRRSSLYAWQLQYGLSTDTSVGSVPTESEASVGGNTGGNAGGSNPPPPAKGGGILSLPVQSTPSQIVDAFTGNDFKEVMSGLGVRPSTGQRTQSISLSRRQIPSGAKVLRNDSDLVKGLRSQFSGAAEIYLVEAGSQTALVIVYSSTPLDLYLDDPSKWFQDRNGAAFWRFVP